VEGTYLISEGPEEGSAATRIQPELTATLRTCTGKRYVFPGPGFGKLATKFGFGMKSPVISPFASTFHAPRIACGGTASLGP
jgi:hypothetical protein